jgi:hypothetical protein
MCLVDGFQADLALVALVPLVVLTAARREVNGPSELSSGSVDDPRHSFVLAPPASVGRLQSAEFFSRAGDHWPLPGLRKDEVGRGELGSLLRNPRHLAESLCMAEETQSTQENKG